MRLLMATVVLLLSATVSPLGAAPAPPVYFDWFEYSGHDAAFETPLPAGHYRNPILAGFHADPSIVSANGRFYLVNSSFTYFPGIPVFESVDLVHWKQIGNVIDRPGQLDFDGLSVSRGIFAPAIAYHDGMFYVVTTAVDSGGNFIATARDPAGPWSDPHWLPGVGGIDPSLFFDEDGTVYLLNNDEPPGPQRYEGHRAIWMQQIDLATFQPVGPRKVLIDGGVEPAKNPIWIEGPHLYKRDGWYYLSDAEGGTGPQHSQVVLRSRDVWGPYVPYADNPILTQRDLPDDRPLPITNAGHADLVEGPDGSWWAVFLASRNYDTRHYNTGRETYLLPVEWRNGWPVILPLARPSRMRSRRRRGCRARRRRRLPPATSSSATRSMPRCWARDGCACAFPNKPGQTCAGGRAAWRCIRCRRIWTRCATRPSLGAASSICASRPAPR